MRSKSDPSQQPAFIDESVNGLEASILELGLELEAAMRRRQGVGELFDDAMMRWVARDPEVRAAVFRFTDVAPACRDMSDAGRHLRGFLAEIDDPPKSISIGRSLGDSRWASPLVGAVSLAVVRRMAGRFILASDADAAAGSLQRLWDGGVANSLDLLGEATVSATEADAYADRCATTLRTLSKESLRWRERAMLERDSIGRLPRAHLSIKISALTPDLRADDPARGVASARDRLRELLRLADQLGAHLHIDMESLDHRDAVLRSTLELLDSAEFSSGPSVGIVHQAYLKDSGAQLDEILEWARRSDRSPPILVRLVKGAYWDHEVVQAAQAGWTAPVFETRGACDRNYEMLTTRLIDAHPVVRTAVASHNLRSVAHAIVQQRRAGLSGSDVEYQVLYGLGDEMRQGLTQLGLRVRAYCPIGDLVSGMAYLVRRLLENTSNNSFLSARGAGDDPAALLKAP